MIVPSLPRFEFLRVTLNTTIPYRLYDRVVPLNTTINVPGADHLKLSL